MKSLIKQGLFSHGNSFRNRKTTAVHTQLSNTTTAEFKETKTLHEIPDELKKHMVEYLDDKTLVTSLQFVNKVFYNFLDDVSISDRMAGYNVIQKAKLISFIKKIITYNIMNCQRKNFIKKYSCTISAQIYETLDKCLIQGLLSKLSFKEGRKFLSAYEKYQGFTDQEFLEKTHHDLHIILENYEGPGIVYIFNRERSLSKTFIATNRSAKAILQWPLVALGLLVSVFLMAMALLKIYDWATSQDTFTILNSIGASLALATASYVTAFAGIYTMPALAKPWIFFEPFKDDMIIQIKKIAKYKLTENLIKDFEKDQEQEGVMETIINTPSL